MMPNLNQLMVKRVITLGITGILLLVLLFSPIGFFSTVDAGHVGVVTRFGAVNRVANTGIIAKLP